MQIHEIWRHFSHTWCMKFGLMSQNEPLKLINEPLKLINYTWLFLALHLWKPGRTEKNWEEKWSTRGILDLTWGWQWYVSMMSKATISNYPPGNSSKSHTRELCRRYFFPFRRVGYGIVPWTPHTATPVLESLSRTNIIIDNRLIMTILIIDIRYR